MNVFSFELVGGFMGYCLGIFLVFMAVYTASFDNFALYFFLFGNGFLLMVIGSSNVLLGLLKNGGVRSES